MNITVPIKLVPDLVEELTIAESGAALDTTWLRLIINEFDEHAIEQAILLKEHSGGQVTIVAPDVEGIDDVLYTAAAKGADRLIKITGAFEQGVNNHALARIFAAVIKNTMPDLILTGVQAHPDLDGPVGPLLAEYLGVLYVGYISGLMVTDGKSTIRKEYPGGLIAELVMKLPAVLGIQAAEKPPRYVAVSKVRQVMKTAIIEEVPVSSIDPSGGQDIIHMFQPEVGAQATMIVGNENDVATQLVGIFKELGVL